MRRLFVSAAMVTLSAGALLAGATGAFFSDTETSTGNTFTAGAIDLKLDNESYYNGEPNEGTTWEVKDLTVEKFFDFLDLKPDDYGEDTVSIRVDTNDAYLCADVTLTSNNDNTQTEPEALVDTNGLAEGELADLVNFIWWADDGDNVLENDENVISQGPLGALTLNTPYPITLADSDENIWNEGEEGGPVSGNTTLYIGKAWCFGNIGTAPLSQDGSGTEMSPAGDNDENGTSGEPEDGGFFCNGVVLGNESQTDSLTADVSFSAVQARHNGGFQCEEPEEVFRACTTEALAWADGVVLADQGKRKDGTAILAARANPLKMLGPAETLGLPSDSVPPGSTFYSLGFNVGTTSTRSVIVSFDDNVILDGAGADVRVYEVTGGTYPDETAQVSVSQDGSTWYALAPNAVRDEDLDIASSGLAWAKYVRVTDLTDPAGFENTADGFDVDAVQALNCGEPVIDGPIPTSPVQP